MRAVSEARRADAEFINCVRAVLGLDPIPYAGSAEPLAPSPWELPHGDGNRQVGAVRWR